MRDALGSEQGKYGRRLNLGLCQGKGSAWPASVSRARPRSKPCGVGLSGYHRQMRAAFSPAWPWPNPSIERTF